MRGHVHCTLPLFLLYPYMNFVENILEMGKLVNVFSIVSSLFQVFAFHLSIIGFLTMHLSVSGAVVLLGGVLLLLAPVLPSLWLLGLFWAERLWGAAHVIKTRQIKERFS
jgi:hypothetical protein